MTDPTAKGYTAPQCSGCGYTEEDARTHMDHHRCRNYGNAPWEVKKNPKLRAKAVPEPYNVTSGHSGCETTTGHSEYVVTDTQIEAAPESGDEASPLPVEEKFTIYIDGDGDYIIQANREAQHEFLVAHGATPNEAVHAMRQMLDLSTRARMGAEREK